MDKNEILHRVKILKKVNIFSETEEETLSKIAQRLREVTLKKGEAIIYKGERGHAMFIIVEGGVKVHDGDHIFTHLTGGQVFGEYSLVDTEVRSASVTGVEETVLYRLEQDDFYSLLSENLGFAKGILKILIARLRELDIIQEQLASSNKRIKKQKEEIQEINHELQDLNEEKNHLLGIVAHDLRNPLTSSISISNSIKEEIKASHPDLVEYMDGLINALWRMNDMIGRILDVRAVEAKQVSLNYEKVKLDDLINEIVEQYRPIAGKKEISIDVETVEGIADLDEGYTRQIFENLVSNAIKFSPAGKSVSVILTEENGNLIAMVKDEGPGLTESDKKKLFGKFQKLSAEPTAGESSIGLGLSIVKKYVDEMNGVVRCESENGKGANFIVEFKKM